MMAQVRAALEGENFQETLAGALRKRHPIPQSASQAILAGQHYIDERVALFVGEPSAKVEGALAKITADAVSAEILEARAGKRRKQRKECAPRTFTLQEPLIAVINPSSGANASLRLDSADGAALAVLNDHLAMPQVARSSLPVKLLRQMQQYRF